MSSTSRGVDPVLILDAIRKRWQLVLLPVAIAPLLALVARHYIGPKMKATATVLVQESVKINPVMKDMMVEMSVNNRIPEIASLVKSRRVLERVLRALGEVSDKSRPDEIEGRVASYRSQIDVFGEGGGLIKITVVGRWTNRVYDGLNLLTQSLIEEWTRPQQESLDQTVGFLAEQVGRVKEELEQVEEKVRKFKEEHADDLPEVHKLNLETHQKLVTALIEAETALVAAEQRQKLSEERLASYNPATAKIAKKLARARATLRALQSTYTSAHPQVQLAASAVAGLEAELKKAQQGAKKRGVGDIDTSLAKADVNFETALTNGQNAADLVVKGGDALTGEILSYRAVVSEVESLRQKADMLRERVKESMDQVRSFATHEQELNQLLRTQSAKSKTYETLLGKYEDAVVSRSLATKEAGNYIRVVEEPTRPTVAPQYSIAVVGGGGLLGGLLFGLSIIFALEFFDRTVRVPNEVEALTGVPVLGTLPAFSSPPRRKSA